MNLIEILKTTLNDIGLTFISDVPDAVLGIAVVIILLLLLRTVYRLVSAVVKMGCTILVVAVVAWILFNLLL